MSLIEFSLTVQWMHTEIEQFPHFLKNLTMFLDHLLCRAENEMKFWSLQFTCISIASDYKVFIIYIGHHNIGLNHLFPVFILKIKPDSKA